MRKHLSILLILHCLCLYVQANKYAESHQKDTSYTTQSTYLKIKKQYPNIKIVPPVYDKQLLAFEDIVYKLIHGTESTRKLHLDIYRPNDEQKRPALIMVHGGGWRSGNKSMERPMAQQIAKEGYVTIPVEYRLSPESSYPAAIYDIKAAIRWVKENAERYGVDTVRIAIEGESAGGQLASLVAMTNGMERFEGESTGYKCSSTVHAAIDVDGIVDFLAPNSLNIARKPDSPDILWLGGTFEQKPLVWKEASPIYWVRKNSVPIAFITSSVPRFHAGRDEMIDLLDQHGIYSESHQIPNSPHSFWMYEPWFEPTKGYIVGFLERVFNTGNSRNQSKQKP